MSLAAHGGKLINRLVEGKQAEAAKQEAKTLTAVTLSERETCDLEMLAIGALSPLEGFMTQADYEGCIQKMRLANGLPWTIPITKSITTDEKSKIKKGDKITLQAAGGEKFALLEVADIFKQDKKKECESVYGTADEAHPGAKEVYKMGDWLVGGQVTVFQKPGHADFPEHRLDPKDTRALFEKKGWKTVVAFQTRNPIHRAHEYLTKVALESVDGLLIHPLVGQTKKGDISAEVRMQCYQVLLDNYYPKDRTALTVFPAAMRYAGPKEAVWHAIVRKNYGCTHFIVGRDHAGANKPDGKSYYGTYDAQLIFDEFSLEEIGIQLFKFEHTFFDKKTGGMVSFKTAPPNAESIFVSGTKLREMLQNGEVPPPEITRPEVAKILIAAMRAEAKSSA